ncbi:MAG: cation-translocating P-type ATPase [Desulfobacteraceae bacterium]|nr:cation-translocating P-type ATPase [Desulfobacteraceae bacterium]
MANAVLKVHGMDCIDEVRAIKSEMRGKVPEDQLHFDVLNEKLIVTLTGTRIDQTEAIALIKKSGFKAEPWESYITKDSSESFFGRYGQSLMASGSALFLITGYTIHAYMDGWLDALSGGEYTANHVYPLSSIILYCFAIILGAWFVFPKALNALKRFRADMNLLMVIAVIGAITLQQWFEAAAVSTLFALALLLESWSVGRARKAIKSLMSLAPETARFYADDSIVEKPLGQIEIGTICLVRPGERIPFDGKITKGNSYINEAPITGESLPVEKNVGANIYAGTINGDQTLEFEVMKSVQDSTLARIISMIEDAQSRKAATEQWVEKFAARYTPIMIGFAILIAILPPLLFNGDWSRWFYEALVILVIACPCALVISTPVSIVAGLSRAARNGILIKGGNYLERPAKVRVIAFDKTGTLTKAKPAIQEVVPLDNHTKEQLLANAAALEINSDHPLAKAIISHTKSQKIKFETAESFEIIQGKGAQGLINGKRYWLGSHNFVHDNLSKDEACIVHDKALEFENQGHSVVVIGCDDHICGLISIADEIRNEAYDTIQRLKLLGVEKLIMLTGDNEGTARTVAAKLKIDYKAQLLPEDKVSYVQQLRDQYEHVVMIGDGINDAPAMATAEFGVAMGVAGSDAAIETADIALMSDELSKLPWLIQHSKNTINIIKQNIYFAIGVKAVFIVLALLGLATLWMAIAADMGASLIVIFNGLRLLRMRKT